jgi:hypothetical protein
MANTFGNIGSHRAASFASAMDSMNNSSFGLGVNSASGADSRLKALEKAQAWADRGVAAIGGQGDFNANLQAQAANANLQLASNAAIHDAQMDAAREAQDAQNTSSMIGLGAQALGLILCERRLKTDIESLDPAHAWAVIRDLPIYSFHYKTNPGPTVYGPMIDEVEPLDPSLVRPSLLPPDEEGPIHGFDVMRHQAYESAALQAALHRIEGLEADLAKLQDAVTRLLLERTPTLETAA